MAHYDLVPNPNLHPEIGLWIAAMNDSTREWRENLETPSQAAITWQPYEGAPSMGGILLHIASCEQGWVYYTILDKEPDTSLPEFLYSKGIDMKTGTWPAAPDEPFDWYLAILERSRATITEALIGIDDPGRVIDDSPGVTCTIRWILAHLVQHDSYHGGQCVTLHESWKVLGQN